MPANSFTLTDKIITNFIKEYIVNKKLCINTLTETLKPIFTKEDLDKILDGSYIFTIKEFNYIINKLNINIEPLDFINDKTEQTKIN